MDFLRTLIESANFNSQRVSFARVVAAFEKLIIRFEKKELEYFLSKSANWAAKYLLNKKGFTRQRFSLFMLWDPCSRVFDYQSQSLIFDYWRKRQQQLRRPLLRCYWGVVHSPFSGFGKQNSKKIAFQPRKMKKKKTRVGSRYLRGICMLANLKSLRREMRMLQNLLRMVTLRERLKLRHELLGFWALRADLQVS